MNRHYSHLTQTEQRFIDLIYIQIKTFDAASKELGIDISEIRQLNVELEPIWRPITKIRDKWKTKEAKSYKESPADYVKGNFWDFYDWVKMIKECCHYCGVTQEELNRLHNISNIPLINSRPTRGRTFEIDRKESKKPYSDLSNLTYACYWCNNAKTDTFTEEEFMLVGKAISTIWKQRLANDNR